MVITITMRNVRLRNGIYEFRMAVPADCLDSVGKKEITQSLKTSDRLEAAALSTTLTKEWKKKFKEIRKGSQDTQPVLKSSTQDTVADFRKSLFSHIEANLADFIDEQSEEDLSEYIEYYDNAIAEISANSNGGYDLTAELGIEYPLEKQKSPGMTRKMNRAIIEALSFVKAAVAKELGTPATEALDQQTNQPAPTVPSEPAPASRKKSLIEVMNLMFMAKDTSEKFQNRIETEIQCLMEWCEGKTDVTQYTKVDLVDYIHNCLPYIPARMNQKKEYQGKSLKECVELVKSDAKKHEPISYKTCENRYIGAKSVFTYAKDQLGLISTNPVSGIKIPVVRTVATTDRAFSADELSTVWTKIVSDAHKAIDKYPERYWSVVLSLYHGFRQNEVCSLKIKDVQINPDGIYIIRIQEELGVKGKTTKTSSSNRIVPIHPYVLNDLGFNGYVKKRQEEATADDMLFPNVTYVKGANFGRKVSRWFNAQKKILLPADVHHKNFHSLRHTFIQQAQNQANMPDRFNQEITGHAVSGVSNIHLGYSGRLKPKDVLVELSKVKYGWE